MIAFDQLFHYNSKGEPDTGGVLLFENLDVCPGDRVWVAHCKADAAEQNWGLTVKDREL